MTHTILNRTPLDMKPSRFSLNLKNSKDQKKKKFNTYNNANTVFIFTWCVCAFSFLAYAPFFPFQFFGYFFIVRTGHNHQGN